MRGPKREETGRKRGNRRKRAEKHLVERGIQIGPVQKERKAERF